MYKYVCRFDHVKVPLDGLLDRYASVSPEGEYSSPIPSAGARFGTMVSAFNKTLIRTLRSLLGMPYIFYFCGGRE